MNQLTLQIPAPLHKQLSNLAEREGVSLNQYIVSSLTQQMGTAYSVQIATESEVEQQAVAFDQWIHASKKCSEAEAVEILAEREPVEADAELDSEVVSRFRKMIQRGL